jgi:hypothetical protein
MKRKRLRECTSLLLLCCLSMSGCIFFSNPLHAPTVTFAPSPIISLTPTFTLEPTSTPTFTPTSGSTLSIDQILANIFNALKTNNGCRYPCWLGITPGLTSRDDALNLLEHIGLTPIFDTHMGGYTDVIWYPDPSVGNSISYDIHLEDNVVSYIYILGQGYHNRTWFIRTWNSISPEAIIMQYGTPSRIWIESFASVCEGSGPCITSPYYLWLFYDVQGFLIKYEGIVDLQSTFTFCPTFSELGNLGGSIEIYLKSLEDTRPLEDLSGLQAVTLENTKSLESITGMSLDEFAAHYRQNDQSFCFSTPREIWP